MISKRQHQNSKKSQRLTKFSPINKKEKHTINMVMKVQDLLEVQDSQVSENPILIFIMQKMCLDTFSKRILWMMTYSKYFSAVKSRRKTHHLDLVAKVSLLIVILSFQEEVLVQRWEEDFLEHKVYLKTMISSVQTEVDFQDLDQIHSELISTTMAWIHIQLCLNLHPLLQEQCKPIY